MANERSTLVSSKKKKVKTGCRTCKTRRIKCDEGRPACRRCVSTGRVCEGYGVWSSAGVIGDSKRAIVARAQADSVKYAISSQYGKLSPEQEACFRWFRHRTYTKLPLPFITPFWRTLVLQACTAEPAILHAVLALGSAHQKESFEEGQPDELIGALDSQQEFMLREYGKAIRDLQPHFSSQDRRSVHVALVVCTLFTFFENLLGRYATAITHLHSGLRLLAETYAPDRHVSSRNGNAIVKPRGYVDDWIIESFARLHVQAALWDQGLLEIYPKLPEFPGTPVPSVFDSTNQAAQYMDRLILDILHLTEQYSNSSDGNAVGSSLPPKFYDSQERLRQDLDRWLAAYNATDPNSSEGFSPVDSFYLKVLRGYHTMALVMLNTCTQSVNETIYDTYTADFISLIEQLVEVWKAHVARPAWHPSPCDTEMPRRLSHSVGDKGWIPLLYFIAVKCRVHRIRLQAVRLLSQTLHKEGIWNSRLALPLATKIIRIEEGDYFRDCEIDDRFTLVSIPTEHDLVLPSLPDHRRLYNIRVRLPEHSKGILTLEYERKRQDDGGVDKYKTHYNARTRTWVDIIE
ncbi:hypothetical protein F4777DRAFT_191945 [Nemania sp. FL0916]|nr:hypothetical protein F4777DRAFT_191945 [Nemania sp. FL0916]